MKIKHIVLLTLFVLVIGMGTVSAHTWNSENTQNYKYFNGMNNHHTGMMGSYNHMFITNNMMNHHFNNRAYGYMHNYMM